MRSSSYWMGSPALGSPVGAAKVEEVLVEEREHVGGGVGRLDGEPVGAIQNVTWVSRENATTLYLLPE